MSQQITKDALAALLGSVTVPDAPLVQPENDLNPKPAALAFRIRLLEDRVATLEKLAGVEFDGKSVYLHLELTPLERAIGEQYERHGGSGR